MRLALPGVLAMLLALPAPAAAEGPRGDRGDVRLDPATSATSRLRDMGRGPENAIRPSGRRYAEGVVLVRYRSGARAAERAATRAAVGATSHQRLSPLARDVERLTLAPGTSVSDAVHALRGRRAVRFAEPDYYVTFDHAPTDELYSSEHLMWGMYGPNSNPSSDYGSGAGEAWKTYEVGSRNIVVGIIDTGVDIAHKDLAPNIWTNPGEIAGNGVDDDDNGYVDDIHGWDFFHDDASLFDSEAADFHGTHVAGTIGAAGNNGEEGVVGVNWAVSMIPMKFIEGEGLTSDAVEALDYLTDLKTRHGLNIVASNNSWGGDESSALLEDAINRGGDAGILFVAAAGNDGVDIDDQPSYPASHECDTRFDDDQPRGYDCLISVAAITETGAHRRLLQLRVGLGRHRCAGPGDRLDVSRQQLRLPRRDVHGGAARDRGDRLARILPFRVDRRFPPLVGAGSRCGDARPRRPHLDRRPPPDRPDDGRLRPGRAARAHHAARRWHGYARDDAAVVLRAGDRSRRERLHDRRHIDWLERDADRDVPGCGWTVLDHARRNVALGREAHRDAEGRTR